MIWPLEFGAQVISFLKKTIVFNTMNWYFFINNCYIKNTSILLGNYLGEFMDRQAHLGHYASAYDLIKNR
jgi:hypothetical protein